MIALIKDITVWHSVMSWNDVASVAYSTEPSPGHCVLWQYSLTPACHPTYTSTSLLSLTLLIYIQIHSKCFLGNYVYTIHNGWTTQAPDNSHGRSTGIRGGDGDMQQEGGCSREEQGVWWAHGGFGSRAVDTVWPCRDGQTGGHFCSVTTGYSLCILC